MTASFICSFNILYILCLFVEKMQLHISLVSTYLLISCLIRLANTYIDNIGRMDFDYVLVAATIQFHFYARESRIRIRIFLSAVFTY